MKLARIQVRQWPMLRMCVQSNLFQLNLPRDLRQHEAHGVAQVLNLGLRILPHHPGVPLAEDLTTWKEMMPTKNCVKRACPKVERLCQDCAA